MTTPTVRLGEGTTFDEGVAVWPVTSAHGPEQGLAGGRRAVAVGDGGMEFLRAVEAAGSLRGAAARVRWSYRHALRYLTNAERACGAELVARARGGHTRGGARLTPTGRDLVRRYAKFRRRLDTALHRFYTSAFRAGA